MPLLEVVQTRQISASIRLTDTTATQVDQYAAFIRACADDVVEQALAYVFSKDRDFQDFLKTPEARKVASTLRIRKAPAAEASEPAAPKPLPAARRRSRIAGEKRLILHFIPGQSHCGAAHRKNVDTPPLRGSCRAPKWFHCGNHAAKRSTYAAHGSRCNHAGCNRNRRQW